ncbi:N-acetyl-gamma-glutamyl-phosphate reductase [Jannaschia pagri]|uniref:N-acetyl-gamma-glutamyl-phosphate reductase n=1 Tax=Jannaschia pagri TaxID=2829797 RepID=A0ABQ4NNZ9_9RHOB|nr:MULTISPECIES: N-acetyl-gamma-glutamyl-phosphate reductase [unclassified Jannaschia]GIT92296.1 N-acetyl-gamma-glutamyl-phosphate reductase [Jannaschia sp. AI_61]GIT96131.1 N-acetyl-gamma-glutamyl-phosphate reductase [Jannaschia sp. AI_62]
MPTSVFIDGEAGTTGLQIRDRLANREDIRLISLDADRRKDTDARRTAFREADVAILCLPDDAARQAVTLAGDTRIIDASTAHRVAADWVYGMPELPGQRERIAAATRVANVGCFATGAIAILRPLTDAGLVPSDAGVVLTGVSGYTGGGKSLIAEYEAGTGPAHYLYAHGQTHKHLPEIMEFGGMSRKPAFQPAVGGYAQGMAVQLHLHADLLPGGVGRHARIEAALREAYAGDPFVGVETAQARIDPQALNGTNRMVLSVQGDGEGRVTVVAVLDNLGKGASGTAVQNLNLMIGAKETEGLT